METTQKILTDLADALIAQYQSTLAGFPIKQKVREALLSGFKDGVSSGVRHTVKMLDVKVKP